MMKWFIFLLLITNQFTTAQQGTLTVALETFKELKVFDGLSVNLIKSKRNTAVISGEFLSAVSIINEEGILKIKMNIGHSFKGYKTFVDLYYSNKIIIIDVNEDAKITAKSVIVQDILELKAQEGGKLFIEAAVEQLLVKSVTGGVIRTVGRTDFQDVQINTGGVYEGKNMQSKFSTINVNAGSKAEVFANEYVKVTVKAGGQVFIYGKPPRIEEKTIFGGSIKKM